MGTISLGKIWFGILIVALTGLLSQTKRTIEIVPAHYLSEMAYARSEPIEPPPLSTPTPQEYLARKTEGNVALFDLANAIINTESGWKSSAHNKSSTASGLFQFLNSTFQYYCIGGYDDKGNPHGYFLTDTMDKKEDPYIQIDCGLSLLSDGGMNHWWSSSHSWSKYGIIYKKVSSLKAK